MTEQKILESTYLDKCTIRRLGDVEDEETGITEQGWYVVAESIKCALSQNTIKDSLPVVENTSSVNVTYDDQKLFISPGIDVLKGDQISIVQSTGHTHELIAKKAFYYPTHTEINLTGRDVNG